MATSMLEDQLKEQYLGKTLHDVPTPSVILDLAKLEVNCQRMLDAVDRLSLSWRPHIKTHKTTQLTRLQVGDDASTPVKLVVSTVLEAENSVPLLKGYQGKGRKVNVLLGVPLFPSGVDRLSSISSQLGPEGLALMIDHPEQLSLVEVIRERSGHQPLCFMKVDAGYHRAGVIPSTPECEFLVDAIVSSADRGHCVFHGIYAHAGQSYDCREDWQALDFLTAEFKALEAVAAVVRKRRPSQPLTLSVGATPQSTSFQHPDIKSDSPSDPRAGLVSEYMQRLTSQGLRLEVHAGVYPTLDLQQLATHARDTTLLSSSNIAISVLFEVSSLYPRRGPKGTTEAMINGGCLALGREPCADMGPEKGKHYNGFGIVTPWRTGNPEPGQAFPAVHGGWQVGKVSQEHGILRWKGPPEEEIELKYGQRVRIWPNHSCVAGACYDKYFIVDSRLKGREDEIIDVWPRWRGW
ncbi:putative serine dehydratase domain-containing protein [Emericellopsis atlantica]|uniref:D-serine dehydratase n=1 Tax=Emericellopsis atlantica TaxID=2614577 RepID=A0A9P7ZNL5_9HYPO|nr:putative serine dehydratase domain-containing protein [Emericellopsis atlantica]KAG9254855.1 putative serine dehydratase domain-containing protein [Emericellopsis atlantica]